MGVSMKGQGAIESCCGATARSLRGQGATEYLVLLAVVLIIALVSIALLGFFPVLAVDAKITQSATYWNGDARPFAIKEHSMTTAGVLTLVLMNNEASGTLSLTAINISGAGLSGTPSMSPTSATFAPGETRTITLSNITATGASAGNVYEVTVNISYTTPNSLSAKQYGAKPVMGKYT